ncbi:hypothetical protein NG798_16820 [Ancylothrix sp. C2]|uniref:DUF2614 family zinc ribbon-containing protein n=1 Tax=Ancylothrix sp. D3o TaxID=2953691 RepID=UPI0021BBA00B|nr:DUF2614 family zinc ribbon-containing protein [Ancylothrix sp. D3o]MCT7951467.1 hypothetical protein [Ancylothrix sp. D3o]
MTQRSTNTFQFNLSGVSNWLTLLAIVWLVATFGLGWLVNSLLILLGLALFVPAVAFFGLRWWLNRNLIQAECPVCSYEMSALNQTQLQCANCGEPLQAVNGQLERLTPPGTIDVKAVDISAAQLEDK